MGWLTTVRRIGTLAAATLAVAAPAQAANLENRWATTEFPGVNGSNAAGVAVQPDGRLVVAGSTHTYVGDWNTELRIALARYNPDLSLDPSFSQGGRQMTVVDADRTAYATDVASQPDGKIVVAGSVGSYPRVDFLLARYRADGSLDPSFGTGGIARTDLGNSERFEAVAVQPDGTIVAAGRSDGVGIVVARHRTDGSLDPSFGGDGMATIALDDWSNGESLAIQADGKVVVAGGDHVVRFGSDGSLDASFGTGGVVRDEHFIAALALQDDGRIVTSGASWAVRDHAVPHRWLARLVVRERRPAGLRHAPRRGVGARPGDPAQRQDRGRRSAGLVGARRRVPRLLHGRALRRGRMGRPDV